MRYSKLKYLMELLSLEEQKELEKWLKNLIINKEKASYLLFNLLKKEIWDKEHLFKKLYPNKIFNSNRMNVIINDLVQSIEQFLIIKHSQTMNTNLQLAEIFQNQNLPNKFITHQLQKAASEPNNSPLEKYYLSYQKEILSNFYDPNNWEHFSVSETLETLNEFYNLEFLKIMSIYTYQRRFNLEKFSYHPTYQNIHQTLQNQTKVSPLVLLYDTFLQWAEHQSQELFCQLKQLLEENNSSLKRHEKEYLYMGIRTLLITLSSQDSFYIKELHLLNQICLKEELLLREGYLDHNAYYNIMLVALRVKQYEWVFEQAISLGQWIKEEMREDYISCILGHHAMALEHHKGAIQHFTKLPYDQLVFMYAKINLCEALYLRSNLKSLITHLDWIEKSVERLTLDLNHKTLFLNTVHAFKALSEIGKNRSKANNLLSSISKQSPLNKNWFVKILTTIIK